MHGVSLHYYSISAKSQSIRLVKQEAPASLGGGGRHFLLFVFRTATAVAVTATAFIAAGTASAALMIFPDTPNCKNQDYTYDQNYNNISHIKPFLKKALIFSQENRLS